MAERVTKVRLSAEVSAYNKAMMEAAQATRTVGTEAEKLQQKREAFESLGRGALIAGAAMTAASALTVKAAMDWESAWAGVTKTVEGTPAQLAEVENGLRQLARELPASHTEIAAVAEAAGQLGIQTENVVAFTRTMIDLGETTNLSATDAATALARFTNIMGTSQSQVSNLGSALVGLGNNYATTESEILEMSLRLAGAGAQIGLTEGEVLGLATSLSSVGIEAEAGGSAISKVMIDIAASVEKGGDRLEMFAEVAGMSADEFAAKWRTSPSEALSAFVTGLANAESQGTSTLGVLEELGITEVRMRDALLRSAAAAGQFSSAMQQGNAEFEANNALQAEAAKRYETTESKLAIMNNSIRDAAISFGETLLPVVAGTAEALAEFANFIGDLPEPVQGLISIFGAAAGAILLVGGAALTTVPKIAQFQVALAAMNWSMRGVALAGGAAVAGLGILVAVIGTVVAAQAEAQQKAKAYADTLEAGTNRVTQATREMAKESLVAKESFLWWEKDSPADAAERLGVSLDLVTEAALGSAEAQEELQRQIDEGADGSLEYANAAVTVEQFVSREADAINRATDAATQKQEADKGSAESSEDAAEAYMTAADSAEELTSQITGLIDKINEANGVGQDAVSANARYQEALAGISAEVQRQRDEFEQTNGTLDGFTLSLDESTVAGSANASMLADVAGRAQDAALKQFELDQRTMSAKDASDKYYGTLTAQRAAFEESARAAGFNADEVQKLADKVFGLPDEKAVEVIAQTARAQDSIEAFIRRNADRRFNIYIDAINTGGGGGRGMLQNANGNMYDYQSFADGGFPTGIYKGGTPIHKFAEPETGWEAYVSGRPGQRNRNIGILMEAGRRLGMEFGGGSGFNGNVYVQNPVTGEYLLATFKQVADESAVSATSGFASTFRGGRR